MKIKLTDIRSGSYAAVYKNQRAAITFNNSDIEKALNEEYLEERSFQGDLDILRSDWDNEPNFEASINKQKKYHIDRIAYIIKQKLFEIPVLLYKDINPLKDYLDGGHRIWAAKYLGKNEIEAFVVVWIKKTMN